MLPCLYVPFAQVCLFPPFLLRKLADFGTAYTFSAHLLHDVGRTTTAFREAQQAQQDLVTFLAQAGYVGPVTQAAQEGAAQY